MKITILEHPRLPSDAHFNDIANTPLWSCLMGAMSKKPSCEILRH
jgi:hypothetical protein